VAVVMAAGLLLSACAITGATAAGESAAPPHQQTADAPPAPGGGSEAPPGPQAAADRPPGSRPGVGLLSPLATIGYIPLKMIPCSMGAAGSLVGLLFTFDMKMVQDSLTLNCGGDWIVTPGMLEGTQELRSVGRIQDLGAPSVAPPPSPPPRTYAPPLGEPGGGTVEIP
jgi:hypothetical protein